MHLILALATILWASGGLPAAAQSGRTFYIDYASGSNSNPGTKASPWKTHPYMQTSATCTGTGSAPSYFHEAGDHFVFKGGVTWPAACFQMTIQQGGTSSAIDYYGVDQSWFTGGSWARPLFDLNYQFPGSGNHVIITSGAGLNSKGLNYITIDNFEIARQNMHTTGDAAGAAIVMGGQFAVLYASTGTTVKNVYIHDWVTSENICTAGTGNNCNNSPTYGTIYGAALVDNVETDDAQGYAYYNNVKAATLMMGGCVGCTEMKNSNIHNGWLGCSSCVSVHDSQFHDIQQNCGYTNTMGIHTHVVYEDWQSGVSTTMVYNNAIYNNNAGLNISVNYVASIYNNVLWNNGNNSYGCHGGGNVGIELEAPNGDSPSNVGQIFNNTIDQTQNEYTQDCIGWASGSAQGKGTLYYQNNICLDGNNNDGGYPNVATLHKSNNRAMSTSEASTYGFTSSRKYFPSSSDPNVAGKGINPMSLVSSSSSSILGSMPYDAAGAPWFGGSYNQRGSTWDLGAFVAGSTSSGSSSKPEPPNSLIVTVQ